ncbi:MAG: HAD family phosphatase [Candidatus Woesearchaeota archaeon]|nr:HAD family phosphatase [Candidatus Woesearchaeota archaeon]
MTKGFIFDFDGVIVDTESKKFKDFKKILKRYDYDLNDFSGFIGKKTSAIIAERFPNMPDSVKKDVIEQRRKLQYSNMSDYKLITGMKRLIEYLKSKKYVLAITTGSERMFVNKILKIHSILGYFDAIICGDDFIPSKPNPEGYKITLRALKLLPKEVIVIEDSIAGIKAAKKIGCKVFAVKTYLKTDDLAKADRIFKNGFDILNYLKTEDI